MGRVPRSLTQHTREQEGACGEGKIKTSSLDADDAKRSSYNTHISLLHDFIPSGSTFLIGPPDIAARKPHTPLQTQTVTQAVSSGSHSKDSDYLPQADSPHPLRSPLAPRWLPGRLPCRGGRGRAARGCHPCPRPGRDAPSAAARRAGGPSGSPSGGRGPRAGARRPGAGAGESRLPNPLLAAAVAPRGVAGAGAGGSGSRGR